MCNLRKILLSISYLQGVLNKQLYCTRYHSLVYRKIRLSKKLLHFTLAQTK